MSSAIPMEEDDDLPDDDLELQRQDAAYQREYENEHSWENLQEDEQGMLHVDRTSEMRARRKRLLSAAQSARIRKGMIRYLLLVVDLSRGASAQDLRPNRMACMLGVCKAFVREFFDQNPLSQLGIAVMRNGVAERLTDLSGTPEAQVKKLSAANLSADGDASLQNVLDLSVSVLRSVPPYGHRELLVLLAALSTCDPGNIFTSLAAAKEHRIRVSVVGVAAEVYVCRRIAEDTGGTYGIALHEQHLDELMMGHAPPPAATSANAVAQQVHMGFPRRNAEDVAMAVYAGADCRLIAGSYTCPRCQARAAELPCECHICGLTLISSPHLARSYHHLFPVVPFEEVPAAVVQDLAAAAAASASAAQPSVAASRALSTSSHGSGKSSGGSLQCFGCLRHLYDGSQGPKGVPSQHQGRAGGTTATASGRPAMAPAAAMVLRCQDCQHLFCYECDLYVHEHLHNCPGCECAGGTGVEDGG